jgi:uncharacterized membrane protein YvlD (DUF360 family)
MIALLMLLTAPQQSTSEFGFVTIIRILSTAPDSNTFATTQPLRLIVCLLTTWIHSLESFATLPGLKMASRFVLTTLGLFANLINAQIAAMTSAVVSDVAGSPETTALAAATTGLAAATSAAPVITASVLVSIYLDEKYADKFGPYASVISADASTTAYAFPTQTTGTLLSGFNYTEIGNPGQTWIYTSSKNIPVRLVATCSILPGDLVDCGEETFGQNTAQADGGFTMTLPYQVALLHTITVTDGLDKLPKTSATPTSTVQSSASSTGAGTAQTAGAEMVHAHSFWILSAALMAARLVV